MKSVLILGKRGSGKSFLMEYLLSQVDYSFTVDTIGDFPKSYRPILTNINSITNLRQIIAHYIINMPEMIIKSGCFAEDIFNTICELIIHYGKTGIFQRPFYFAVDEMQKYCDRYDMPEYFSEIVNIGRHYNIFYLVNTRRYPEIHKDIIGNTDEFFAGASMDVNDIHRMNEIFGKDNVDKFVSRNVPYAFLHRSYTDSVNIVKVEHGKLQEYSL